jgi:hypothetical protein
MQFEMFLFGLASKLGVHPVNIAHFLEISTSTILSKLACNRLLEYAIYMYPGKFEMFLLGFASKLDLHPVTI